MNPLAIFNKNWSIIKDKRINHYKVVEDLLLKNNNTANIAIYKDEKCIAFGNFFYNLKLPTDENVRYYFHLKDGFVGCGTESLFWFFFDENRIIINDHKYKHPYDELMNDYYDFLNRLTEENI